METSKIDNDYFKKYFILYEVTNELNGNKVKYAKDSWEVTLNRLKDTNDLNNLAETYFLLGKSHKVIGNLASAIEYLKKVDSIFNVLEDLHSELICTYEELISYEANHNNKPAQLKFVNQLIRLDSIFLNNDRYLSEKIKKEFDTPIELQAKDKLIEELMEVKRKTFIVYSILIAVLIPEGCLLFYQNKRSRKFLSNFKLLEKKLANSEALGFENNQINELESKSDIEIPIDIVESVLKSLEIFESKQKYLDPNITLHSLSKEFKSNSSYVSKIINRLKGKNLSDYLNDLRISYATNRLYNDKNFRNYSIKAVAKEVGFKTAETFSKKFLVLHGIYPSYFLKQLNKKGFSSQFCTK